MEKQLLSYITNENLYNCVNELIIPVKSAISNVENNFHKNVIDPFSMMFDTAINRLSTDEWIEREKSRQIQKTLQNNIGMFHQSLIGKITGWENLGIGQIVDLRNKNLKIIAEIKNKYNTTKGNHKIAIYDDLKAKLLSCSDNQWLGYYVEIIRKTSEKYCYSFTPSDNKTGIHRPADPRILVIDGESFYHLATGSSTALLDLYKVLPIVLSDILNYPIKLDNIHEMLFEKAFHTNLF